MGFEEALFKVAEEVGFPHIIVDQADDLAGASLIARDHVKGFEPEFFDEIAFLHRFRREVGEVQGMKQGVVGDDPLPVDVSIREPPTARAATSAPV
jgi:hypothetical protein